jgi:hypothetical protein
MRIAREDIVAVCVLALLTACSLGDADPEVARTSRAASAVMWLESSKVGVSETPHFNDLTKTATQVSWNAGAVTVQTIERLGYAEFTTGDETEEKAAGLSHDDPAQQMTAIDFAIYLDTDGTNGTVRIRENGVNQGTFGGYDPGDRFRIDVTGGVVTYWKQSVGASEYTLLYTSASTPVFPLRFATAMRTHGATIRDVTVTSPPAVTWLESSRVNASATPDANDLFKTATQTSWNAGAVSVESIERRGYVEFTTGEATKEKAAGLSNDDPGQDMAAIDFAIYLESDGMNGTVRVRENGVNKGVFGSYVAGDVFRLEARSGKVTYYKNGTQFYESQSTPVFPLRFAGALRHHEATIRDVVMSTTRLHIATQRTPLPAERLLCGASDVVSVNGSVFLQIDTLANETVTDFVNKSDSAIAASIDAYLANNQEMASFDGYVIMDIEKPHLADLWDDTKYSDSVKNQIVDAFIRRIRIANQKFKVESENPNVRIGVYGTLVPDEEGLEDDEQYSKRLLALIEAGKPDDRWGYSTELQVPEGLYDSLDFLVPILYPRFGCDVSGGPCDAKFDSLADYTKLGVTGSQRLESSLMLLPLLTVYVANLNTAFQNWMLMDLELSDPYSPSASLDQTIGVQLDVLSQHNVHDAALWIGAGTNYDDEDPPTELRAGQGDNTRHTPPWTMNDYACGI